MFLEHAMTSLKDNACRHFSRSRVGVPVREGDDNDYWNH